MACVSTSIRVVKLFVNERVLASGDKLGFRNVRTRGSAVRSDGVRRDLTKVPDLVRE